MAAMISKMKPITLYDGVEHRLLERGLSEHAQHLRFFRGEMARSECPEPFGSVDINTPASSLLDIVVM